MSNIGHPAKLPAVMRLVSGHRPNQWYALACSPGAFDEDEELTTLGKHLANLPVDPGIGKMLIYAAMFGCLDPCLTVAAALSDR